MEGIASNLAFVAPVNFFYS